MSVALIVTLVTLGSSASAAAAPATAPTLAITVRSEPGETMDDFAARIGPAVVEEAMRRSAELCGEIRRDGTAFALDLYTTRGLRECSYRRFAAHDYTGLTYHTHIHLGETDWHRLKAKQMNPRFSDDDYAHPGYLATERKVMFQNGRGTERRVRPDIDGADQPSDRAIANPP